MKRFFMLSALPLVLTCGTETGTIITIDSALVPDEDQCIFDATATEIETTGFFDPSYGNVYSLGLRIVNHLGDEEDDPVSCPGGSEENCQIPGNIANIVGFETCVFRELEEDEVLRINGNGPDDIDCGSLPEAQQLFITTSGAIHPGSIGLAVLHVLSGGELKALYGDAFDALNIPRRGAFREIDQTGNARIKYSYSTEPPNLANRSPTWGNFPTDTASDRVIVRLRGKFKLQSGKIVRSNWFSYPVQVCMGCARTFCGDLDQIQCNAVCDGQPCPGLGGNPPDSNCHLDNSCQSTCAAPVGQVCDQFGFIGKRLLSQDACLIHQGFAEIICEDFNSCLQGGP